MRNKWTKGWLLLAGLAALISVVNLHRAPAFAASEITFRPATVRALATTYSDWNDYTNRSGEGRFFPKGERKPDLNTYRFRLAPPSGDHFEIYVYPTDPNIRGGAATYIIDASGTKILRRSLEE